MRILRRSLFAAVMLTPLWVPTGSLVAQARPAARSSPEVAGRWEGIARVPGQGALRVVIALDSTAAGWQGTLGVPSQSPQPFTFASIGRAQDSVDRRIARRVLGSLSASQPPSDPDYLKILNEFRRRNW